MEVVGYLRVSTDRQAEEGMGLAVQQAAIEEWAQANGHTLVGVYRDEGISGTKELDSRPGLADAFAATRELANAGVVVYRLDRLARDLVLQEQLLAEFRRSFVAVYSTSAGEAGYLSDDPDDPSRRLIRQVLGAVSEYERAMISLRLRSGRKRKADSGGFAYGSPRYGYVASDGELVVDVEEQRAVARIEELRKSGATLRLIAETLTAEGFSPKRSNRWHPESIRRVISHF